MTHPGGRPRLIPPGLVRLECLVPREAVQAAQRSAARACGRVSRKVHYGRLLVAGLRASERRREQREWQRVELSGEQREEQKRSNPGTSAPSVEASPPNLAQPPF